MFARRPEARPYLNTASFYLGLAAVCVFGVVDGIRNRNVAETVSFDIMGLITDLGGIAVHRLGSRVEARRH